MGGEPAELRDRLVATARRAGELLLPYFGELTAEDAERKGGRRRDLVSSADLEAESLILADVPAGDGVVAEEGGSRPGSSGRTWVIDPLDGTVNFLRGLPVWAVSLAVRDDRGLAAAVVHAPALGWSFSAARGRGCRMNGAAARVSATEHLGDAILATGFPYARDTVADNNLENVPRVGREAGGLRRMGSAAVDLALVAAGRLDGFWELHLNSWDVAAGILLVREAGGRVTDFRGRVDLDRLLDGRHIVATNGRLHQRLRSLLAPLQELD